MATYTTAQMKAAGVQPAAMSGASTPGPVMLEYILDGTKKAIAAADIVTFHDIPTYAGFVVNAASVEVLVAGVATATMDVGIAGTDVTGLTAYDIATVGSYIKLATAANSVLTTSSASSLTLQFNTAGLGTGKLRVRVFGDYLDS